MKGRAATAAAPVLDEDSSGVFSRPVASPEALRAASAPRALSEQRLMHIDRDRGETSDGPLRAIADFARPGDVWVLNDAATLPASLHGVDRHGVRLEIRLAGELSDGLWTAIAFGTGDWRDDTDERPPPPPLRQGDQLRLGPLDAEVVAVDERSARLLTLRFSQRGAAFWRRLHHHARPVQYRYVSRALDLADVQTPFASRPWAVEAPSAGRALSARVLGSLRAAGATIATLTHAAGLSASGEPTLDALLPLPERFEIPPATVAAIEAAGRVVAVGTSVTRALEGRVRSAGGLRPGAGVTDLRIGERTQLRVVDALLTGAHDPSSSHYSLLRAFATDALLEASVRRSQELGYLGHELGDSWLIA